MKFCQPHWDKLKAALATRGLDKYISKDGAAATQGMLEGRPDPLIAAHNAIVGNALNKVGLDLMVSNADGSERCPICYLKELSLASPKCECGDPACTPEARAEGFERWIDRAADDQLARIAGPAES